MTADPLLSVNAAALKVTFGAHAVERGAEYARTGRVGEVHAGGDASTRILQAAVTGSRAREYVTLVTVRASGVVTSRCSCPVGENCKHGAAVVFAMLERRQPRPDWRQALAAVAASDTRSRGDLAPLGLLLDLAYGRLSIRPVQRSARGKWVKTGVDWDSVQNDWASHWDESQRRAVHELARLRRPTAYGYGYPGQATLITDFGSPLWPTLRAAVAA
ncbi:MAG: SWIM zinc finger family protein, partial [Actinobacteria bacterium]|nr:SWIM zinc finger family protein [Actinomycetota bacterium]